jgi:hypothetical protein
MALIDSMLNLLNKQPKEAPTGSRSEREAKIKDKAGMVINVFALLLAVNAWYGGTLSSTVLNNTIKANDTWAFYQAKSMKQTMAEYARDDALRAKDVKRANELQAKIDRYENDEAKKRSPWIGYASTAYQLSIVVLSASILAVSMPLFWSSFVVAGVGVLLSSQGLLLWL